MGADIAIGSTQRFGVPMFYGGPHAAYMAVRDDLRRQLPGRLVGISVDADGRPAYRLALQAREQHIRRERATSNICTAQVLLAVAASMYACYHGADGLAAIARGAHRSAATLAATLRRHGLRTGTGPFFDTVRVLLPGPTEARAALRRAREAGYNLRDAGDGVVQVACDETTTREHLRDVVAALVGASMVGSGMDSGDVELAPVSDDAIPASLARTSKFLTHPVFSAHRSETAMLRYLRRLADLDVALDRSMIPLGSCTMKLNATAEMEAITWPEFAGLHPLAPAADAEGYAELIGALESWLCAITGYDAVSVQPNAGSQGELAGLLAIRAYHAAQGCAERDVCLIPESAHGTNAASAVLAGLRVTVVKCGDDGAISLADLAAKLAAHDGRVAAIMLTYPSTNGVYETTITQVCDLVHEAGGQVYIDGANLNALAGLASPAQLGGDVSHLNLHKTFCIPHGGGGPGVGPVAVKAHLAAFLPGRPAGPVAAAPYGSAGILPISWAYIAMMGAPGLRQATQVAVLSANYIARRLTPYFPVLHTGGGGLVAHEVHRGPAQAPRRDHRRRRGQAADRLRVPRAHHVVPRGRHVHDRADREREPRGDRGVLRRDDRDQGRDRQGGVRRVRRHRQPAEERAAHRADAHHGGVEAPVPARRGRLSRLPAGRGRGRRRRARRPPSQVLAPGPAHRPGLRRPPPGLRLPAPRSLRVTLRDLAAVPVATPTGTAAKLQRIRRRRGERRPLGRWRRRRGPTAQRAGFTASPREADAGILFTPGRRPEG